MASALKFSEAFVLGLHASSLIADKKGEKVSVSYIADELKGSLAHLQKVLQRLVKAGVVQSTRGPKGGYVLAQEPGDIRLLDIYEAIDGKMQCCNCLFDAPVCSRAGCILGNLTSDLLPFFYCTCLLLVWAGITFPYNGQVSGCVLKIYSVVLSFV